ncbi:hypothetical protein Tco_1423250 [Tanacetum coccineum]
MNWKLNLFDPLELYLWIEGNGTFNAKGLDSFIKQVKMAKCGLSYAVVVIMEPQSSDFSRCLKSTLSQIFIMHRSELTTVLVHHLEIQYTNSNVKARCAHELLVSFELIICVASEVVIAAFVAATTAGHWDIIERMGR